MDEVLELSKLKDMVSNIDDIISHSRLDTIGSIELSKLRKDLESLHSSNLELKNKLRFDKNIDTADYDELSKECEKIWEFVQRRLPPVIEAQKSKLRLGQERLKRKRELDFLIKKNNENIQKITALLEEFKISYKNAGSEELKNIYDTPIKDIEKNLIKLNKLKKKYDDEMKQLFFDMEVLRNGGELTPLKPKRTYNRKSTSKKKTKTEELNESEKVKEKVEITKEKTKSKALEEKKKIEEKKIKEESEMVEKTESISLNNINSTKPVEIQTKTRSLEETPVNETPVKETPVEETPTEVTPAEKTSIKDSEPDVIKNNESTEKGESNLVPIKEYNDNLPVPIKPIIKAKNSGLSWKASVALGFALGAASSVIFVSGPLGLGVLGAGIAVTKKYVDNIVDNMKLSDLPGTSRINNIEEAKSNLKEKMQDLRDYFKTKDGSKKLKDMINEKLKSSKASININKFKDHIANDIILGKNIGKYNASVGHTNAMDAVKGLNSTMKLSDDAQKESIFSRFAIVKEDGTLGKIIDIKGLDIREFCEQNNIDMNRVAVEISKNDGTVESWVSYNELMNDTLGEMKL